MDHRTEWLQIQMHIKSLNRLLQGICDLRANRLRDCKPCLKKSLGSMVALSETIKEKIELYYDTYEGGLDE